MGGSVLSVEFKSWVGKLGVCLIIKKIFFLKCVDMDLVYLLLEHTFIIKLFSCTWSIFSWNEKNEIDDKTMGTQLPWHLKY